MKEGRGKEGEVTNKVNNNETPNMEEEIELDVDSLPEDPSSVIEQVIEDAVSAVEKKGCASSAKEKGEDSKMPTEFRGKIEELEKKVEDLEQEAGELKEYLLRTLADFDNFRKRSQREREESRKFANVELFRDLLPIYDNLCRALEASGDIESVKKGVELIIKQFEDLFAKYKLQKVANENEAFDPKYHEAVFSEESREVEIPTVKEIVQQGFALNERLVRPALVRVLVPCQNSNKDDDIATKDTNGNIN